MLQEFNRIKYYILTVFLVFSYYAWASFSGTLMFGDDNSNKGNQTINNSGSGHYGGHGYYFHK